MGYRLQTRLYAVFSDDFQHGGRFYTHEKDGYQSLSEEERACIHIDGEPTVELDFSGMQPRLLYSWGGIQYNGDPYVLNGDAELRDLFKIVFFGNH